MNVVFISNTIVRNVIMCCKVASSFRSLNTSGAVNPKSLLSLNGWNYTILLIKVPRANNDAMTNINFHVKRINTIFVWFPVPWNKHRIPLYSIWGVALAYVLTVNCCFVFVSQKTLQHFNSMFIPVETGNKISNNEIFHKNVILYYFQLFLLFCHW